MSQQYPPPPGPAPGPHAGPPATHGPQGPYASPYAVPHPGSSAVAHPGSYAGPAAYLAAPSPSSSATGFNPWVAGLIGVIAGGLVTAVLGLAMLLTMGFPMPWEGTDDWADDWTGQVDVASGGSVSGPALADAVRELGGGFYEDVTCPSTPEVAADATTLCAVDDGFDSYRVVVVFLDDAGAFEAAEIYTP